MQNKTFYKFIKRLLDEEKINVSAIADSIVQSPDFNTLVTAGFIEKIHAKTGGGSIKVKNRQALQNYFIDKFPSELKDSFTAIGNVRAFRNSKAGKRLSQNVILLRGLSSTWVNGKDVDLPYYTTSFGAFSASVTDLKAERICFVENLDSFFLAEQVISSDYVFAHTYGGLGRSLIAKIQANQVLFFPDYDFKGLHNYLLTKSIINNTELFIPSNYDALFKTKSRTIKTKQGREQQPSELVLKSIDPLVVKIRNDIFKTKRFLEQQALFT